MHTYSAVIVGLGVHGTGITARLAKAGIRIVGAADPSQAGKNLGEVAGDTRLESIVVAPTQGELDWDAERIDIAVLTPKVDVPTLTDLAIDLLGRGANVITIVEDAFDLERFAPAEYARLDTAARAADRTFVATGSQDTLWAGLVLQMSSQLQDLTSIRLETHLGVDGYPAEFLTWCGIGNTHEQFAETAAEAAKTPSVFGAVLPVIASKLGLTVTDEDRSMSPYVVDAPLYSETFGREIAAGDPVGRRDLVRVRTAEGIELTAELNTTAVMGRDEFVAEFEGTPRIELRHKLDPANVSVDATLVNRIPDVVNAPAGVIRAVDLPTAYYRHVDAARLSAAEPVEANA